MAEDTNTQADELPEDFATNPKYAKQREALFKLNDMWAADRAEKAKQAKSKSIFDFILHG